MPPDWSPGGVGGRSLNVTWLALGSGRPHRGRRQTGGDWGTSSLSLSVGAPCSQGQGPSLTWFLQESPLRTRPPHWTLTARLPILILWLTATAGF